MQEGLTHSTHENSKELRYNSLDSYESLYIYPEA